MKPQNHVTRAIERARTAQGSTIIAKWPEVPEDLVAHLERLYPPRCYEHARESLEDHIEYSGFVSLTQLLRSQVEEQRAFGSELDGEDTD